MSLVSDLKILYRLAFAPVRGSTHAERLESFYGAQAQGYDAFRERLLKGRRELFGALEFPADAVWLDLGGGTGANAEFLGERIGSVKQLFIVDLSPSLLKVADERIARHGWTNVKSLEADVTTLEPPIAPVDVVTFSYSLTMIPDWFAAIDRAKQLLRPGGLIGVVDFFVARKHPTAGQPKHPWSTRTFWPLWFNNDNVFPNPDHIPYLQREFETVRLETHRAKVPYLPFVRAPYYQLIGRKPLQEKQSAGV